MYAYFLDTDGDDRARERTRASRSAGKINARVEAKPMEHLQIISDTLCLLLSVAQVMMLLRKSTQRNAEMRRTWKFGIIAYVVLAICNCCLLDSEFGRSHRKAASYHGARVSLYR